jgi:hypothetical protein
MPARAGEVPPSPSGERLYRRSSSLTEGFRRHYRSVGHSQARRPPHPQLEVHDSHLVSVHLGGPDGVLLRERDRGYAVAPEVGAVALEVGEGTA